MQITKKIIIALSLLIATSVSAEQSCLSVVNSNGCSKLSGSYEISKDQNACGYLSNDSICCCKKPTGIKAVPAKYIIIGSVVVVLGVATVLSFLLKKSEYEE